MKTTISENQLNRLIFESVKSVLKEGNENISNNGNVKFTLNDFLKTYAGNSYSPEEFIAQLKPVGEGFDYSKVKYSYDEWLRTINGAMNARKKHSMPTNSLLQLKNTVTQSYNKMKTQGINQKTGKFMTIDEYVYEAGLTQYVNPDALISKWKINPQGKADANRWKQIFTERISDFGQNAKTIQQIINSYNPQYVKNDNGEMVDVSNRGKTGDEDFANATTIGNSQGTETMAGDKKMTSDQLIELIQRRLANTDSTITITDATEGSTAFLRTQGRDYVTKVLQQRMNQAKPTVIQKEGQEVWVRTENIINNWLSDNPVTGRDLSAALSRIGRVISTSRNEMPVTKGFQNMLNLFGIKDDRGQAFVPDGKIGPKTSKALSDAGFKDIYAVKEAVKQFQTNHNVPPQPDGIAGKNTIAALRQAGINSFEALKQDNQKYHIQNRNAQNPAIANVSGKIPVKVASQMNAVPNTNTQTQGIGRRTLSETDLKKIITKSIIKEVKKRFS